MKEELYRVISIPDLHKEVHNKQCWELFFKFIQDTRKECPRTDIQHLGDSLDLGYISRHNKNKPRKAEGKRILDDYKSMNKDFERERKHSDKIIFHEGNHENWIEQYIDENPSLEGIIELDKHLKVDELIRLNKVKKIGKLYYMHGHYTNQYHAKKTVDTYKRNIVYCHTHDIQSHTAISPIDRQDYHTGRSIGAMCSKNPDYLKGKPNKWVNGFHVAYFDSKGYFTDYQIVINKGQFIWKGKLFKL